MMPTFALFLLVIQTAIMVAVIAILQRWWLVRVALRCVGRTVVALPPGFLSDMCWRVYHWLTLIERRITLTSKNLANERELTAAAFLLSQRDAKMAIAILGT